MYGKKEDETWQIDMIIDGAEDLRKKLYHVTHTTINQDVVLKEFLEEILPPWIKYFENLKMKNEGDWFVGKDLTIADIAVFTVIQEVNLPTRDAPLESPIIKQFYKTFCAIPKYAAYSKSPKYHT